MREKRRLSFMKEVASMMFGYGDAKTPRHDTTMAVHDYTLGYIKALLVKTHNMA
ncbi:hypothetical protein H312_00082, partial [Anncaliia algerae PRA339]